MRHGSWSNGRLVTRLRGGPRNAMVAAVTAQIEVASEASDEIVEAFARLLPQLTSSQPD